jgi:hypothetical protein
MQRMISGLGARALAMGAGRGIISITMSVHASCPGSCMPAPTAVWYQQAGAQECAMAKVVGAGTAFRAVLELTARYQHHTASPAEFSAALWPVLTCDPEPPLGEETGGRL